MAKLTVYAIRVVIPDTMLMERRDGISPEIQTAVECVYEISISIKVYVHPLDNSFRIFQQNIERIVNGVTEEIMRMMIYAPVGHYIIKCIKKLRHALHEEGYETNDVKSYTGRNNRLLGGKGECVLTADASSRQESEDVILDFTYKDGKLDMRYLPIRIKR